MTELVERVADAIDNVPSFIDVREQRLAEARAAILETLRQIREPGEAAQQAGMNELPAFDWRYETPREVVSDVFQAMIDHLITGIDAASGEADE